jgi:hypothetical protein
MLDLARRYGHVKGLAYHLIEGGISHLQYADDTVLLLDYDEESFAAVKFLLYCFEAMSGLKINYQKSEVFGVGLDPDQVRRVANIFNCNVGNFPMTYLGLPISMDRILAKDLAFVPQKVDKKLGSGFNALASSGGRAVLINSCLDSIANYAMGFYLLDEGNHHKMDMSRARFFWEGVGEKQSIIW